MLKQEVKAWNVIKDPFLNFFFLFSPEKHDFESAVWPSIEI